MSFRWKIGNGLNYVGVSGFVFPEGENPQDYQETIVKRVDQTDVPNTEYNILFNMGTQQVSYNFSGILTNKSDFEALRSQVNKNEIIITSGKQRVNRFYEQRFYPDTGWFYYVRNGQITRQREARRPNVFSYSVSFNAIDPFRYSDIYVERTVSGLGGTTPSFTTSNDPTAVFMIPEFEFLKTSGGTTIQVSVSASTGGSATINLSLLNGEKVVISPRLRRYFIYGTNNVIKSDGSFTGDFAIPTNTAVTFTFGTVGGGGTFKAICRNRFA